MKCPYCGQPAKHYRCKRREFRAKPEPEGNYVRFICVPCHRFLGYLPIMEFDKQPKDKWETTSMEGKCDG